MPAITSTVDGYGILGNSKSYHKSNNWVIGVDGGRIANGTAVIQWWPDGSANQRWKLTDLV